MQEFCNKQQWVEDIYEFLKAWNSQKLEDLRGSPISDYVKLVRKLKNWQERVSNMPVELLTKTKLLLLSGRDVQEELGKCVLSSLYLPSLHPYTWITMGLEYPLETFDSGPSLYL